MQDLKRNVMRSVNIGTQELLEIVTKNLATHIADYNEAMEGYRREFGDVLKKNAVISRKNFALFNKDPNISPDKLIRLIPIPPTPRSYADEYKRAIRMLELSADVVTSVEDDVFNQLVLDEWSWKQNFVGMTSLYKGK
jgi:hypothetical protein